MIPTCKTDGKSGKKSVARYPLLIYIILLYIKYRTNYKRATFLHKNAQCFDADFDPQNVYFGVIFRLMMAFFSRFAYIIIYIFILIYAALLFVQCLDINDSNCKFV
jgi:hypothetical protein